MISQLYNVIYDTQINFSNLNQAKFSSYIVFLFTKQKFGEIMALAVFLLL